jgi:homoserine kinase
VSFAGVMPLHLAVEEGFVDMAAYLVHWGADKTARDGSKKTAVQHAQARCVAKKTKDDPNSATLLKCAAARLRRRALARACAERAHTRSGMRRAASAVVRTHSRFLRAARLLTDDAFLKSYVETLLPRLAQMRARARLQLHTCAIALSPHRPSDLSFRAHPRRCSGGGTWVRRASTRPSSSGC